MAESASDPQVLFTSIFDDPATTTLVPNPINVTGETSTSNLGPGLVGQRGHPERRAGGDQRRDVPVRRRRHQHADPDSPVAVGPGVPHDSTRSYSRCRPTRPRLGTHVYVTNNNFFHNFDAAMQIEPNGLLAGDPLHPLVSGHPFFHGNVLQGNGIDGMAVVTSRSYFFNPNASWQYIGPLEANLNPFVAPTRP